MAYLELEEVDFGYNALMGGSLIWAVVVAVGFISLGASSSSQETPAQPTGRPRREAIPKSVKMYVWQRDGGRCVECGSNERLEYDHIIPLSKGGSNTDRNLQLLCERCNRSKGSKMG